MRLSPFFMRRQDATIEWYAIIGQQFRALLRAA